MRKPWFWTMIWLLTYALTTFAQADWSRLVVGLEKTVARLELLEKGEDFPNLCSGAILNATAGYVLTAAHCVPVGDGYSVTVDGRHAELVRINRLLDLAVIRTSTRGESIPLAEKTPGVGGEVAILGFAFGSKKLAMQFGRVSLPLDDDGYLMLDTTILRGDSGGPAINPQGELVGMSSALRRSGGYLAVMIRVEAIRDFAQQYLPPKQP